MPETLEYASPSLEPLPLSKAGSDSLIVTGVWLSCLVLTLTGVVVGRVGFDYHLAIGFGVMTLMTMVVFVPLGFILALFGIAEKHSRRTSAYVCASINGAVLMSGVVLIAWRGLI